MTAQIHETLILDGKSTSMAFCPPLPDGHERLKVLTPRELKAMQEESRKSSAFSASALIWSTACWRRYVGTWELRDKQFYLVSLMGEIALVGEEPIFADWFTGVLRIPQGKQLCYVHMGFGSVHEEELHIFIEKGRERGRRVVSNREKPSDARELGRKNLPGRENRFDGDTNFN